MADLPLTGNELVAEMRRILPVAYPDRAKHLLRYVEIFCELRPTWTTNVYLQRTSESVTDAERAGLRCSFCSRKAGYFHWMLGMHSLGTRKEAKTRWFQIFPLPPLAGKLPAAEKTLCNVCLEVFMALLARPDQISARGTAMVRVDCLRAVEAHGGEKAAAIAKALELRFTEAMPWPVGIADCPNSDHRRVPVIVGPDVTLCYMCLFFGAEVMKVVPS